MKNTVKCAHCGAQIVFDKNVPIIECKYCDSMMVIEFDSFEKSTDDKKFSTNPDRTNILNEKIKLRKISPNDKFKARYELGEVNQRGKLWITDTELLFKPNLINLGEKTIRYIPIIEIESISKLDSWYWNGDRILIKQKDGYCVAIHVKSSECNDIIAHVRKRKTILQEKRLNTCSSFNYSSYNGAKKISEIKEYEKDYENSRWFKTISTIATVLIFIEVRHYRLIHIKDFASTLGPNGDILILAFLFLGLSIVLYKLRFYLPSFI